MNAPHRAAAGEPICYAISVPADPADPHSFYVCTAQAGHDGPEHGVFVAEGPAGSFSGPHWPVTPAEHRAVRCWCETNHYADGLVLGGRS